jgi:hypothetical protein
MYIIVNTLHKGDDDNDDDDALTFQPLIKGTF